MSSLNGRFDELKELLDEAGSVVVTGHENADGDAVGAVGALRRHLEIEQKQVLALLLEPINPRYRFMALCDHYEVYEPERHDLVLNQADVIIMCDLSMPARLGAMRAALESGSGRTVCVDHHPCDGDGPADVNLLDPAATASGRIVWDYIQHVGGKVDRQIAESVFVSLCTDTGWFNYPNTDADVLVLAAELASYQLDLLGIHKAIYQSHSPAMLRLLGHAVRSMHEELGGEFLWTVIRAEFVRDLQVDRLETDPILDVLRAGRTVRAVLLFTEREDGSIMVSLRSSGDPDVNQIAREFGGGGHVYSAGTSLPAQDSEEQMRGLVAAVRRALRPA